MTIDNQTQISVAPSGLSRSAQGATADYVVAAVSLAVFAIWIFVFRFHNVLEEYDLYAVLSGLLDGVDGGKGLASPLQYGASFGFGYIAALYWFVNDRVLRDPDLLIPLMNQIGTWAAIIGAACFWLSTRLLYGVRVATIALIPFVLSPMMLQLGTSGHQILLAFALFAAGSIFLFLRTRGWTAVACEIAGCLLLLIAMTVRAEIFLALPYVVLARADFQSVRRFLNSVFVRCIGPALAFVSFFLMKHFLVDRVAETPFPSSGFFDAFYTFTNIPKGVVVIFFGFGGATTLLGLVAAWWAYRTGGAGPEVPPEKGFGRFSTLVGPVAMFLPPFAFWIANPVPTRHFILCLSAIAIVIGQWLASWRRGPAMAYGLVAAAVLANQGIASTAGPVALKFYPSPYFPVAGVPRIVPRVLVSTSWAHRRDILNERERVDRVADELRSTCDQKVVLFTAWSRPIFVQLYAGGKPVEAQLTDFNGFPVASAKVGGREFAILSTPEGWPRDAVADVLHDRAYDSYKLMFERDTMSENEKTPIPADRAVRMGCQVPSSPEGARP